MTLHDPAIMPRSGATAPQLRTRATETIGTTESRSSARASPDMAEAERLNVGDRPINLTQVLKLSGWVMHGGEAKALIAEGRVRVNGEVETRKRKQMARGDIVALEDGPSLVLD